MIAKQGHANGRFPRHQPNWSIRANRHSLSTCLRIQRMEASIPDAISHRSLQGLLKDAVADQANSDKPSVAETPAEWAAALTTLMQEVSAGSDRVAEGRTPQQVMALGACRAHLMMALQALKAVQQ
ncbi:hypothetical protein EVJ50_03785 [Synechococcus sp. RSCCF101]|uniref:hypothetical protein n=1 Tax=Synechococcus sp. RSCCF101 TaxID=2511069 RepID=UPI001244BBB4|nr:hypothetical protein [Synechococcus sp. RSCCF101]QEY31500.1 hypothetical protein EVJ50_03785 [Synechococcus sp. RSCCF101]